MRTSVPDARAVRSIVSPKPLTIAGSAGVWWSRKNGTSLPSVAPSWRSVSRPRRRSHARSTPSRAAPRVGRPAAEPGPRGDAFDEHDPGRQRSANMGLDGAEGPPREVPLDGPVDQPLAGGVGRPAGAPGRGGVPQRAGDRLDQHLVGKVDRVHPGADAVPPRAARALGLRRGQRQSQVDLGMGEQTDQRHGVSCGDTKPGAVPDAPPRRIADGARANEREGAGPAPGALPRRGSRLSRRVRAVPVTRPAGRRARARDRRGNAGPRPARLPRRRGGRRSSGSTARRRCRRCPAPDRH